MANRALVAAEVVGLAIDHAQVQHAQLAVLADLELRKPAHSRARVCCDHGSKPPARQHAEREDIAVPGRERKLRAGLLEREHECIALASQHALAEGGTGEAAGEDRKSTRLNSSHVAISYAVF